MRRLVGVFVACALAVSGCASIPISTALSLSSLSASSVARIDPSHVRVRLSVPMGYELDVAASRLDLTLGSATGKRTARMGLSLLGVSRESRSGGLFSADVAVTTYTLSLTPEATRQLREAQRFLLTARAEHFAFSVNAPFAKVPAGAREVTFWADLRLSLSEPFMPLVDAARIRFDGGPAGR